MKTEKRVLAQKEKKLLGAGFGVFLLLVWQTLSVIINDSFLLPGPFAVGFSLWTNRVEIFTVHLPSTMKVVLAGGSLSVLLGIVLAILMDASAGVAGAVYPVLTVTQTVPVMCIAPAFVLWLGYTAKMRILVVVLVNFFSVTVDLYDGFQSTGEERTELLETYGAGRLQQFYLLRMPSALPYLFSALHVAVPWSVVGAAVSEWLGAPDGLGTYSRYCLTNLDAAGLLAPLFVLTAVALLLNALIRLVEQRALRWSLD